MQKEELWPLAWEALQALRAHYGPAIDHAAESLGIPYGEWYGWLMAAFIFEPEPISAQRLATRSAYTAPARLEAYLQTGVRLGLLEPMNGNGYRLTAAGRRGVQQLIDTAYAAMAPLRPVPEEQVVRLLALLYRLVQASLDSPQPPGSNCLRIARHYDPGTSVPAMVRLDQYLSDLDAFRDDARLAAWRPLGVTGVAWDAFTSLWRHGAATVDELHARLARRGYSREAYLAALEELIAHGWVEREEDAFRLTDAGAAMRREAETLTDRYFYAPWECLNSGEIAEVVSQLTRIRDALAPQAAA
jgi:DNA-binding MarR family transcriptional regulator